VLEKKLIKVYETISISVTAEHNPALVEDLLALFKKMNKKVLSVSVDANIPADEQTVLIIVKTIETDPMEDIREGLKSVKGIKRYKLN